MTLPTPPVLSPLHLASALDSPTIQAMLAAQQAYADQMTAQQQATGAQMDTGMQQYAKIAAAGAPQVNPTAEFATNLAGNVSQAIAPSMGGQQAAGNALTFQKDKFAQQHLQTLNALQMNLGRLAARYQEEGNHEQAAQALSKQMKAQIAMQDLQSQNEAAAKTYDAAAGLAGKVYDAQAQVEIERQRAAQNLQVEKMKADSAEKIWLGVGGRNQTSIQRALVKDGNLIPDPTDPTGTKLIPSQGTLSWGTIAAKSSQYRLATAKALTNPTAASDQNAGLAAHFSAVAQDELSDPIKYAQRRVALKGNAVPVEDGQTAAGVTKYKLDPNQDTSLYSPSELAHQILLNYGSKLPNPGTAIQIVMKANPKLSPEQKMQMLRDLNIDPATGNFVQH